MQLAAAGDVDMSCAACEKRQAQEQRQLSDCESRCKEINAKNQKLTIALAVMTTLVGKESLDFALGLSSTLDQISSRQVDSEPVELASAPSSAPSYDRKYNYSQPSLLKVSLFDSVPPLTPSIRENDQWFVTDDDMWSDYSGMTYLPETGGLALGLLLLAKPNRKR